RGMADAKRFSADGRPQVHVSRDAHAALEWGYRLRGSRAGSECTALLQLERLGQRGAERVKDHCHMDSDAHESGALLRMEQSGFRAEDDRNYQGANYGWQRYCAKLESVVAELN